VLCSNSQKELNKQAVRCDGTPSCSAEEASGGRACAASTPSLPVSAHARLVLLWRSCRFRGSGRRGLRPAAGPELGRPAQGPPRPLPLEQEEGLLFRFRSPAGDISGPPPISCPFLLIWWSIRAVLPTFLESKTYAHFLITVPSWLVLGQTQTGSN
jgi:hypothetical protein